MLKYNANTCFVLRRGVTRLDGVRGKKQAWCPPMFESEIFRKQMYSTVGVESTCDTVGSFRRPPEWFGPPFRVGELSPLSLRPWCYGQRDCRRNSSRNMRVNIIEKSNNSCSNCDCTIF